MDFGDDPAWRWICNDCHYNRLEEMRQYFERGDDSWEVLNKFLK